ncbi:MAG: biopolymer transporter ExbD [Verrucomicrobiota bacterium]
MKRFGASGPEEDDTEVDISPLIDCVFILLIFFIVTTVFVKMPDADVSQPVSLSLEQLEKESIFFAVTAEGNIVYGGDNVGLSGVRQIVKRMTKKDENLPVVIKADAGAPYGLVTKVQDEANLGGAMKVSFAMSKN